MTAEHSDGDDVAWRRREEVGMAVDRLLQPYTFDRAEKRRIYFELMRTSAIGLTNILVGEPEAEEARERLLELLALLMDEVRAA